MIFQKHKTPGGKSVFYVSTRLVWLSSLFIGVLASLPKILRLGISPIELVVDSSIAFLFSLFAWYYNIYNLPKHLHKAVTTRFFNRRLTGSMLSCVAVMVILVGAHQLIFPQYEFWSMMLMYQFRGILIGLTIYLFLHLLHQNFQTQQIAIELERTKAGKTEARFELLKQQVNPHFLFNSLNTLKSMVDIGDPHASDFILKLSDFYRSTLDSRKADLIPMAEELEILDAYIFLLKARFENGINLNKNISNKHQYSWIPPFTLQLLVENCIKHNVVSLDQPLHIQLYSKEDKLIVENSIQLRQRGEISTGVGLENINQRYQHLLNKRVEIESRDNVFKVKLPVINENNHH